jgi:isopenicillin N synthase-like dioxygenase
MIAVPSAASRPAVPVIDISAYFSGSAAEKKTVARQIDAACRSIGFLVISGHGVSEHLIERMHAVSRAFFDLPVEIKGKYQPASQDIFRGYKALESNALAYSMDDAEAVPDFREIFSLNRVEIDETDPYYTSPTGRRIFCPNIWPDGLAGFQTTATEYYKAMEGLAVTLMRLFALALDLDEHWFDNKVDKHMTNFVLSNYPDQPTLPKPGQLRCGAHSDYGSLTILKTEDKPGGLEVLTSAGTWAPVPIVPGTFIINLGDLMAQWTNDRWVSTMHRVVNPPRDKAVGSRRQSLVFFHQPNYDALVECLATCREDGTAKYPPITSGEHLIRKLSKAYQIEPTMT